MGFLNDFINSSGIIFEFHYNFIIFFCVWVPRFYRKKFQFIFTPYTPQKMTILAFWHFLALLGFFLPRITHKKNQKMNILTKFDHFGTSWHCSDFFTPYTPKKPKKWIFWQNLAILPLFSTFLGGGQNCQKKDNVI